MKKAITLAAIPLLLVGLSGCSFAKPFGGECDSLKIDVQETRKTLAIIDGAFDNGIVGKQQPVWDAGYDNINAWVDDMTKYNGNYEALKALGKSTPAEEKIIDSLLDDLDSSKFATRLDADDLSWYRDTGSHLDAVAKICGF